MTRQRVIEGLAAWNPSLARRASFETTFEKTNHEILSMTTLLLMTSDRIVRADFRGRSPRLVACWEQARGSDESPITLVEMALALGPRRVRGVWLLTTDATTSVLSISHDMLAGTSPEDLSQLLAFEAEAITGQAAFETSLSHVALPSKGQDAEPQFWITQVPNSWQSAAEDAVRRRGGRLLGIAHPAGVARPIHAATPRDSTWKRLEFWEDLTVSIRGLSSGELDVNVQPRTQHREDACDEVLIGAGSAVGWDQRPQAAPAHQPDGGPAPLRSLSPPTEDVNVLRLTDQQTLERWLTAWAQTLSAQPVVVPVQRIPTPPLSATQRRVVMVACAAAMMLFCGGWHWLGQLRLKSLTAELEQVQAPAKALDQLKQDETKLAKERDELNKQSADVRRDVELLVTGMARQSERQAKLLDSLSRFRDEHLVVKKIEGQAGETRVSGLCLRTTCVQSLARKLSRELTTCGWLVSPAEISSTRELSDGGPWTFKIVLKDLPSNSSPASTPPKENKVAKR